MHIVRVKRCFKIFIQDRSLWMCKIFIIYKHPPQNSPHYYVFLCGMNYKGGSLHLYIGCRTHVGSGKLPNNCSENKQTEKLNLTKAVVALWDRMCFSRNTASYLSNCVFHFCLLDFFSYGENKKGEWITKSGGRVSRKLLGRSGRDTRVKERGNSPSLNAFHLVQHSCCYKLPVLPFFLFSVYPFSCIHSCAQSINIHGEYIKFSLIVTGIAFLLCIIYLLFIIGRPRASDNEMKGVAGVTVVQMAIPC